MIDGLLVVSIIGACVQFAKEAFEPTVVVDKPVNANKYPEPHKSANSNKVIIENNLLYKEDLEKYGAYKTMQFVNQGKYNLSSKELEKERNRIKSEIDYMYSLL